MLANLSRVADENAPFQNGATQAHHSPQWYPCDLRALRGEKPCFSKPPLPEIAKLTGAEIADGSISKVLGEPIGSPFRPIGVLQQLL